MFSKRQISINSFTERCSLLYETFSVVQFLNYITLMMLKLTFDCLIWLGLARLDIVP